MGSFHLLKFPSTIRLKVLRLGHKLRIFAFETAVVTCGQESGILAVACHQLCILYCPAGAAPLTAWRVRSRAWAFPRCPEVPTAFSLHIAGAAPPMAWPVLSRAWAFPRCASWASWMRSRRPSRTRRLLTHARVSWGLHVVWLEAMHPAVLLRVQKVNGWVPAATPT